MGHSRDEGALDRLVMTVPHLATLLDQYLVALWIESIQRKNSVEKSGIISPCLKRCQNDTVYRAGPETI